MGGGPPVPAITGSDLPGGEVQEEDNAGYMDEMMTILGGGKVLLPLVVLWVLLEVKSELGAFDGVM